MFSNIDENVRRSPPLANVVRRSTPGPRKRVRVVFSGGRHLGLRNIGALTCPGGNGLRRLAKGCSGVPDPAVRRDVRGLDSTEPSPADKAATLSPHLPCRQKHEEARGRKARSRQHAVKRAAVGGWMIARWSSVVLESAETSWSRAIREVEHRRVFPRALGGRSPKVMFRRVLVTRNVGCRNGFRGILATCSREGREAQRGHGVERRRRH